MNKGTVIHLNLMHGLFTKGNKAEWSPGRSEIIRLVTNKIERPRGASPICLITRMITDRLDYTKLGYQLIIKITIFVTREVGGGQVTQNLRINRLAQFILFPTPLAFCVVFGLKNGPYASENKEKNERFTMSTKKSASLFR